MTTLEGPKSAITFNSNPLCEINGKNFGLGFGLSEMSAVSFRQACAGLGLFTMARQQLTES